MKQILVLLTTAAVLNGCGNGKNQKAVQQAQAADSAIEVKIDIARRQNVEQIREYTGTINPYSKNMIASQSATRIDKIMVEVGDRVRAGQVLVLMEQTAYLQQKLQVENLKTDYERAMTLYATGGTSKQQIDQLQTQLEVAQESFANLEKNTRLLSPINGVVTQRNFDNGDVTGGQPILQVQQLQPIKILINVQEEYFALVRQNMKADIRIDIYEGKVFSGKMNLIYPTIDNMTHTFVAEIVLPNVDMKVRPGMFARVTLNFGSKDHIVVSDKAIMKQSGTDERYAFVVGENGLVERRIVSLGQRFNGLYEVLNGIADKERVVIAGISKLIDGTAVKIVE